MKKWTIICLLLTFLLGYLEWGKNHHSFIFQAEAEIFAKAGNSPENFLHPFILIPFCGQLILLFTLFQSKPSKGLTLLGLGCLSTLMLLLFFIGITSLNLKILGSTIPFLITGVIALRQSRQKFRPG